MTTPDRLRWRLNPSNLRALLALDPAPHPAPPASHPDRYWSILGRAHAARAARDWTTPGVGRPCG